MSLEHACPCSEKCPLQRAMDAIGGKWKAAVLCALTASGPTRYNELKRKINGISNTMLAKSLKELADDGLVRRTAYMEIPVRVEYEVTPLTDALKPIMMRLAGWGSRVGAPGNAGPAVPAHAGSPAAKKD